jgi:hypothetical protein
MSVLRKTALVGSGPCSAKKIVKLTPIASSKRFSELTDGLIFSFSIKETLLLGTPARLASARWLKPACSRWLLSRFPIPTLGASP